MYANKINNEWVVFSKLPAVWGNKSPFNAEMEGFYEITVPSITSNEKLGSIIDDVDGKPTYSIISIPQTQINLSEEEIEMRLYKKRISEGINTWAMISAKLRLSKENGTITQEKYKRIEHLIKPFREELLAGQWIDAKSLFEDLNNVVIGYEFYSFVNITLDNFITNNY